MPSRYADRAHRTHAQLRSRWERGDGMLLGDGMRRWPGAVSHLWPFARAFVASLDVDGMRGTVAPARQPAGSVLHRLARRRGPRWRGRYSDGPSNLTELITVRLDALERYWDERGPAYASDPPGARSGGDIYYDDNAWVGLCLIQLERRRPGASRLDRAAQLCAFARTGWDRDSTALSPGGVFWTRQGHGAGSRNHDRNAISTAPNAQLMLGLAALGDRDALTAEPSHPTPTEMAAWVREALSDPRTGLIRDKIRGDGTTDQTLWTYNQGSMIGLHVMLAARGGPDTPEHLDRAERLAARALDHYAETAYANEPLEFIAIFVRNLLALHNASADEALRQRITDTVRDRADTAWAATHGGRSKMTLLGHAALVSLHALAAWDPADYHRIV